MIDATTYKSRRNVIRKAAGSGLILIPGHKLVPRNYADNVYPFRQNSHFLYYAGIDLPDLALVIGPSPDEDILFGPPEDIDAVVWHGPHETTEQAARRLGIPQCRDIADLGAFMKEADGAGRRVHFLPPYQHNVAQWMAGLLGCSLEDLTSGASPGLMKAVAAQRLIKSNDEVGEIEEALAITHAMHVESMRLARPGILEADVAAAIQAIALARDRAQSYNPIVTVRGEVLHNNTYQNRLEAGQLMLNDSGCESPLYYASDITRTFPVDGTFTPIQREIYSVVLRSQIEAIEAFKPGITYRDIHLHAARVITEGLIEIGLMRGNADDAVDAGAHALFFCHGLGHALGLDVHDMEDLGDVVGYPPNTARSTQFGLGFLRFAKPLEAGHVLTVEPGVYFIPALIDRWDSEGLHTDFINYEKVAALKDFGGIRIEDDILCTATGPRVLGPPIPKTIDEVEAACAA